jgi:hypothetical protein
MRGKFIRPGTATPECAAACAWILLELPEADTFSPSRHQACPRLLGQTWHGAHSNACGAKQRRLRRGDARSRVILSERSNRRVVIR